MKCLIIAAGRGVRMGSLTDDIPKPMLSVGGKPLLERILDCLPDAVTELIIVVGYRGDQIRECFGERWQGRPIAYLKQPAPLGTGDALMQCRHLLGQNERFLVVYADDLRDKESLAAALEHDYAILVKTLESTSRFGTVVVDDRGIIRGLEEKSPNPQSHKVVTGAYVLTTKIFDHPPSQEPNGEYYINSMLVELFKTVEVYAVEQRFWLPIGYPEDLVAAEKIVAADL